MAVTSEEYSSFDQKTFEYPVDVHASLFYDEHLKQSVFISTPHSEELKDQFHSRDIIDHLIREIR